MCKSAYNAQFMGAILSPVNSIVWKIWAPRKCKIFSWLIIQNQVWTTERLECWGWPNGRVCPLCRCQDESVSHLLFKCCFSLCIWITVKDCLDLPDFEPNSWIAYDDVEKWWTGIALAKSGVSQGHFFPHHACRMGDLDWKKCEDLQQCEHHAHNHLGQNQVEARNWVLAGAKHFGFLSSGE
jgi:hypothetical protein